MSSPAQRRDAKIIHAIANRLGMSDDDYRALLFQLSGQRSTQTMAPGVRHDVRRHFERLGTAAGVWEPPRRGAWARKVAKSSPMERKVWALWNALARAGVIHNKDEAAMRAWVKRQTGMDDLAFCDWAQLSGLIEALKDWGFREGVQL